MAIMSFRRRHPRRAGIADGVEHLADRLSRFLPWACFADRSVRPAGCPKSRSIRCSLLCLLHAVHHRLQRAAAAAVRRVTDARSVRRFSSFSFSSASTSRLCVALIFHQGVVGDLGLALHADFDFGDVGHSLGRADPRNRDAGTGRSPPLLELSLGRRREPAAPKSHQAHDPQGVPLEISLLIVTDSSIVRFFASSRWFPSLPAAAGRSGLPRRLLDRRPPPPPSDPFRVDKP